MGAFMITPCLCGALIEQFADGSEVIETRCEKCKDNDFNQGEKYENRK